MKYTLEKQNANEDEAKVVEVFVQDDEAIDEGSIIMVLETSKAAIEIIAIESGPVTPVVIVGETVPIGAILAYQNETPQKKVIDEKSDKVKVSAKALALMETHGLTIEDIGKSGLIREADVLDAIDENFGAIDDKITRPSPLEGYLEPPVAYFNFSCEINTDIIVDCEINFWNQYVREICNKLDISFAHNLINKEGDIQPYHCDIRQQVTRNDLTRVTADVFRGKKSKQKPELCISYLKSSLDFNHVALLYPGSKMTIAVAECSMRNTVNVSICYDHRHLNGYQLMKIIEACHE